jgi:EmrB/QacA subfamily drug resistance transporter
MAEANEITNAKSGPAGRPLINPWIIAMTVTMATFMEVLDSSIANVALPHIAGTLGASTEESTWVLTSYLVSSAIVLPMSGWLSNVIGRKRFYMTCVAIFTVSSFLCGLATSLPMLIFFRVLQGAGGGGLQPSEQAILADTFSAKQRGMAFAMYGMAVVVAPAIGPTFGGWITDNYSWHWIFFINIPIGIATVLLARRLLRHEAGVGFGAGADVPGGLLITTALMLGVYTIVKPAADYGWGSGRTLAFGGASLALLLAFLVREATAGNPLVPLRIFRSRNVVAANVIQVLSVAGMFGVFFLGALYLRRVVGYDALEIGLAFLLVTLTMGTLSIRYAERLATRFGARNLLAPGLALIMIALILLTQAPVQGGYLVHVLPSMLLLGTGAGICFPALMGVAMAGVDPQDAGLASGLVNTTAQVGGALGLAVLATLSASRTAHLSARGYSNAAALTGGYHLAFWIAAALTAAAIAVVPVVLRAPRSSIDVAVQGAD